MTQTKPIDRYLNTAVEAGCPRDQIENFMRGGYVAQPKQLEFHAAARECDQPGGPTQIGFGGARGPGKSHAAFAQLALDDCQRVDGLKGLYLRKIGKQAKEQFQDLRRSVLFATGHKYAMQQGLVTFDNESRIFIGSFKDEKDIDNYLGIEYDAIVIEEATSLMLSKYRTLRDSNRTSKDGWRPRIYTTTNPGNIGHAWYKELFINPWQRGKLGDTRFIFATVDDNRFIDEGYQSKLEDNVGWKLRAYRYGDWDIAAGQFFINYNPEVHVFSIDETTTFDRYWCAMDYGFQHYTVVHLLAERGENLYVLDEYAARQTLVPDNAAGILAMLGRNKIPTDWLHGFVSGVDVFAKRHTGGTIADEYAAHDIVLERADVDRIQGAAAILRRLGNPERGIPPTLFISDRCHRLIDCLPIMQHDPRRPEDVLKVDVDEDGNGGDDAYDSARYGIQFAESSGGGAGPNPFADYRG